MKAIEETFMQNPSLHDPSNAFPQKNKKNPNIDGEDEAADGAKVEHEQFSNQRLLTPRMRKLMSNKDARVVLHEEVNESVLRLKKAKFGHRLNDIVPDHQNKFYLPEKKDYMPKAQKSNQRSS